MKWPGKEWKSNYPEQVEVIFLFLSCNKLIFMTPPKIFNDPVFY